MNIDQFAPIDTTRRDRYGRYLVVPPDGGKPIPYTRATTIAKTIEDQHSLIAWKARMTGIGLTRRPELLATLAITDTADKQRLDAICEQAAEAGGAVERRDMGTAVHAAIENWLTGRPVPPMFQDDVHAFVECLEQHNLTPIPGMAETMIVADELQVAGRFDLAVADPYGINFISDIKTGASLAYSGASFSCQLAIYASADCEYTQGPAADGSEDTRTPLPPFSTNTAYIFHVQPGSGRCDLHAVDIAYGAEILMLSMLVRDARNRARKLITPVIAVSKPRAVTPRDGIIARIDVIKQNPRTAQLLAAWWPDGVPGIRSDHPHTDEQLSAIEQAVSRVEAEYALPIAPDPFAGITDPPTTPQKARTPVLADPADRPIDDSTQAAKNDVLTLAEELDRLDTVAKANVARWVADANNAGRSINIRAVQSTRRLHIARALMLWAEYDDELLRAAYVNIVGEWCDQPKYTPGHIAGTLTETEALALCDLAVALKFDNATVRYLDSGECRIETNPNTNTESTN